MTDKARIAIADSLTLLLLLAGMVYVAGWLLGAWQDGAIR